MKKTIIILFIFIAFTEFCQCQDYSGTFQLQGETGIIELNFTSDDMVIYAGSLNGNGYSFKLNGRKYNNYLQGIVGEESERIHFEAALSNNYLTFMMFEIFTDGNPNYNTAQSFIFERKISMQIDELQTQKPKDVIINDISLTETQLDDLFGIYGVKPLPGNYWYDIKSGLYGVMGYPSYGFMLPGHEFASMARDVSNGNTAVIINDRELPMMEWAIWSYMLGTYIQPGLYWLDHQGNAGYEGTDIPLVNLFEAARQNTYVGKGGSGDNFWSTRFSAGNSNSDNTQGYVSVPGYGPVGYGF